MSSGFDQPYKRDEEHEWIKCSADDCTAKIKNHAWGKVKSAWFFSKSGDSYCPEHVPTWVYEWRKEKNREK